MSRAEGEVRETQPAGEGAAPLRALPMLAHGWLIVFRGSRLL